MNDEQESQDTRMNADAHLCFERLDQISRVRALTVSESIELERVMQRLGMIKQHFSRRL